MDHLTPCEQYAKVRTPNLGLTSVHLARETDGGYGHRATLTDTYILNVLWMANRDRRLPGKDLRFTVVPENMCPLVWETPHTFCAVTSWKGA